MSGNDRNSLVTNREASQLDATTVVDRAGRLLAMPVLADEDETRVARLLYVVLVTLLAAAILTGIVSLVSDGLPTDFESTYTLLTTGGVCFLIGVLLFFVHRGHVQGISVVLLALLWIVVTYWLYGFGGIASMDANALIYVLIIVLAGLLLGKYASITLTVLSVLAMLWMFWTVQGEGMAFVDLLFILLPVALVGVLLSYAVDNLAKTLNRLRSNERMLAARNRELQTMQKLLAEHNEQLHTTVERYGAYIAEVETGNLAAQLTLDANGFETDDPLLILGHRLKGMVDSLHQMILRIHEAANDLTSAATEILAATQQQASGASEQSAAISQTTTTVDELKTIAEQSVSRAQEVAGAAQRTSEVSRVGWRAVEETVESMEEIRVEVEGIAENILMLSEQTQQVGEIIATVNDIAAQSNMLALNASVEAARAGEYGKGFAVVAVEVRNLAEQSKQATAQVKAILSDIQQATNATVMATEEGTKEVEKGVGLAAQAGESIEQLAKVIEESAQAATQMVAGGRQQASGVEQVALAMQNINQATVQSLASTRQAEKAARDLNELARSLADIVEQYEL